MIFLPPLCAKTISIESEFNIPYAHTVVQLFIFPVTDNAAAFKKEIIV
jgi:hypothetical protein